MTRTHRIIARLASLAAAALLGVASTASAAPITIGFTGATETYTVPTTGSYDIAALGAQGGVGFSNRQGGLGQPWLSRVEM